MRNAQKETLQTIKTGLNIGLALPIALTGFMLSTGHRTRRKGILKETLGISIIPYVSFLHITHKETLITL